ncbi:hypothetical protein SKAU_G00103080 [Synaphobranchus kaupii]|uniref:Uncharacterized protein n=1 Tax=Synaphobranchus kaupii TaxID=118154 RepID=A0A9Q1FYY4_SYNKA|nr:hypothetical protein SKAU_G00103080 [Synaphobranchus kaupii]
MTSDPSIVMRSPALRSLPQPPSPQTACRYICVSAPHAPVLPGASSGPPKFVLVNSQWWRSSERLVRPALSMLSAKLNITPASPASGLPLIACHSQGRVSQHCRGIEDVTRISGSKEKPPVPLLLDLINAVTIIR